MKNLNRLGVLEELKTMSYHNKYCYSTDQLMTIPKPEYEEEWHKENERIEIIEELIEEEKAENFKLYTSMYNLRNEIQIRLHTALAYLENRDKGISCYLTAIGIDEYRKFKYSLVLRKHKKHNFDNEYEKVVNRNISKEAFVNRETLKNEMQEALNALEKFTSKYYEETEELE